MAVTSILAAFDGTPPARHALDQAAEIARQARAQLTLVCVIPPSVGAYGFEIPAGASTADALDSAKKMLAEAKADLEKKGVSKVATVLLEGNPVDRIVEYADHQVPDLIVVGSRGLSEAGRFFLGSVSDGILHHARGSILVVKSPQPSSAGHHRK